MQLAPALDQLVAVVERADEPLAAGDDLDRTLALLEELHRPRHRLGVADQLAGRLEQLDDPFAGLVDRQPGELGVGRSGGVRVLGLPALLAPGHLREAAVGAQHRAHRQPQLAPPGDVGDVAEGAHHHQPRALVLLDLGMGHDRHAGPEQGRQRLLADKLAVTLVVGVGKQRHAGGDQLRPGRLDQRLSAPVGVEAHLVHRSLTLAVLELGLGDRGLEVDVPQGGGLELVGLAPSEQPQERALGDALGEAADGRVGHRPVDRQTERTPHQLEGALVLLGQAQAQLHEVRPRNRHPVALGGLGRGLEAGVVGDRRVTADAVVVLHPALGRKPVVVPAHRVEDLAAAHPHEAGHGVGVGVGEDVTDVQRSADRGRRGVDRVDLAWRRRGRSGRCRTHPRRRSTSPRAPAGWASQGRARIRRPMNWRPRRPARRAERRQMTVRAPTLRSYRATPAVEAFAGRSRNNRVSSPFRGFLRFFQRPLLEDHPPPPGHAAGGPLQSARSAARETLETPMSSEGSYVSEYLARLADGEPPLRARPESTSPPPAAAEPAPAVPTPATAPPATAPPAPALPSAPAARTAARPRRPSCPTRWPRERPGRRPHLRRRGRSRPTARARPSPASARATGLPRSPSRRLPARPPPARTHETVPPSRGPSGGPASATAS